MGCVISKGNEAKWNEKCFRNDDGDDEDVIYCLFLAIYFLFFCFCFVKVLLNVE